MKCLNIVSLYFIYFGLVRIYFVYCVLYWGRLENLKQLGIVDLDAHIKTTAKSRWFGLIPFQRQRPTTDDDVKRKSLQNISLLGVSVRVHSTLYGISRCSTELRLSFLLCIYKIETTYLVPNFLFLSSFHVSNLSRLWGNLQNSHIEKRISETSVWFFICCVSLFHEFSLSHVCHLCNFECFDVCVWVCVWRAYVVWVSCVGALCEWVASSNHINLEQLFINRSSNIE